MLANETVTQYAYVTLRYVFATLPPFISQQQVEQQPSVYYVLAAWLQLLARYVVYSRGIQKGNKTACVQRKH